MTGTDLATTDRAPAPRRDDQLQRVDRTFTAIAPRLEQVLPSHVSVERFTRVTLSACARTPKLLECNRQSLLQEAMKCATDGLVPDGREAALVPFGGEVTYIPMVAGLLKRARQSGVVTSITVHLVREGDPIRFWTDERGDHVKFEPDPFDAEREKRAIRGGFAVATIKGGGAYVERMSMAEIEARRSLSKASRKDAPWKVWPEEMMKKTVLRRLAKRLPSSVDLFGVEDDPAPTMDDPDALAPPAAIDADDGVVDAEVDELDTFAGGSPTNGTAETVVPQGDGGEVDDKGAEPGQTRPPEDEADWSPLVARAYAVADGGGAALAAWRDGLSEGEMEEVRTHLPALNAAARSADAEGVGA